MLGSSSSIKSRIFLGSFHVKVASTLHSVVRIFLKKKQKTVPNENDIVCKLLVVITDYKLPMKPFFIEIQNFCAWAEKLGR